MIFVLLCLICGVRPHKRLTQTCPGMSRSLRRRRGSPPAVACCRVGALSVAEPAGDLLKEVAILFIASTIVWPQVKYREETQRPFNRKLD